MSYFSSYFAINSETQLCNYICECNVDKVENTYNFCDISGVTLQFRRIINYELTSFQWFKALNK